LKFEKKLWYLTEYYISESLFLNLGTFIDLYAENFAMKIDFKLTSEDFLEHQLFSSSQSKLHQKDRAKKRMILPIVYIILGVISFAIDIIELSIFLLVFAIIWIVFYPAFSKYRYKKHFQKYIAETFKHLIDQPVEIKIGESTLNVKDVTFETTLNTTKLKELIETKNHFFIKLVTDLSFIVPKHAIDNKEAFKNRMTALGVTYVDALNWKWK